MFHNCDVKQLDLDKIWRHGDPAVAIEFWSELERFMRKKSGSAYLAEGQKLKYHVRGQAIGSVAQVKDRPKKMVSSVASAKEPIADEKEKAGKEKGEKAKGEDGAKDAAGKEGAAGKKAGADKAGTTVTGKSEVGEVEEEDYIRRRRAMLSVRSYF